MSVRRIYVCSSWRNEIYNDFVEVLRSLGHEVFNWKETGFHWSEIDKNWENWNAKEFINALKNPIATQQFYLDFGAMLWADTFILLMPCGRSAHIEFGHGLGSGKPGAILLEQKGQEPELLYRAADLITDKKQEIIGWLERL